MSGTQEKIRARLLTLLGYQNRAEAGMLATESADAKAWKIETWETFRKMAGCHGISPLLFSRLKQRIPELSIPAATMDALRNDYLLNAAAQIRRFHILGRILEAFRQAGIQVIVLKGAFLAEAVYGNLALRTLADIDLLVRREDIEKSDAVIMAAGCSRMESALIVSDGENEFHYRHPTVGLSIEVHWSLFNPVYPFIPEPDEIWSNALPVLIAGRKALSLSYEDLLLHVAIHASIHCFDHGLRPLCDIAEILARLPIDAATILDKMDRYHAAHAAGLPILLAHRLLGAAVPDSLLTRLEEWKIPECVWAAAVAAIFKERPRSADGRAVRPNMLLFMGRKNLWRKLKLVLDKAFPPRKTIAVEFGLSPESLRVFFTYPVFIRNLFRGNKPAIKAYFGGFLKRRAEKDDTAALMDWLIPPCSPTRP